MKKAVKAAGIPEADADRIIAAYREDYPASSSSDIYFWLTSGRTVCREAIAQAEMKAAQANSKVFLYNLVWNTPVMNGTARAFHTAELSLAMRLAAYLEAAKLSRQFAGAGAAFARYGTPNHPGMPIWEPYSIQRRPTMIFDLKHKDGKQSRYDGTVPAWTISRRIVQLF